MRLPLPLSLLFALTAAGCQSTSDGGDPSGDADTCLCTSNADCSVGMRCEGCMCIDADLCTTAGNDCPAGQFCDDDGECLDLTAQCARAAGCACWIVGATGELAVSGNPHLPLTPGASRWLEAILGHADGTPIAGAIFEFAVEDTDLFSCSGATLTALPAAGPASTTLTATTGGSVSCSASLTNLGDPATGDNLRLFAFDDLTGAPIADAHLVVDYDNDGSHDGSAASLQTDAHGLALTTVPPTGPYAVTVFANGYNYLTVAGIEAVDVALPLSARTDPLTVGGFTGILDFDAYEREVLDGRSGSLRFGIVAASFPFKSLLNFDLEPFMGPQIAGDCSDVPTPAGCYDIELPGLISTKGRLPGGVVLGLATAEIKPHFDVTGTPGRRLAWALGGEVEIEDLRGFIEIVVPGLTCEVDCDDVDIGAAVMTLVPLLPRFAVGLRPNLPLPPTSLDTYLAHIEPPYAERDADALFGRLDADGEGPIELPTAFSEFADLTVPPLPPDPGSAAGYEMEGMLALTGIFTVGYGVVPLGVTTSVDCATGDCTDRIGNAAGFDGIVNGAQLCVQDALPEQIQCPPGAPETVPDGHLGLFHGPAIDVLAGQQWFTGVVALPISSSSAADFNVRATALLFWDHPAAVDPAARSFPEFPTPPTELTARTWQPVASSPDVDLELVNLEAETLVGEFKQRWNIYVAAGTPSVVAPEVPAGFEDPFAEPSLGVDYLGFDLADGASVDDLALHDSTTLNDFILRVEGLTFEHLVLPIL